MGAPPDEPKGWPVKIKDPWDNRKTLAEVWLKDMFDVHLRQLRKVFSGGRQDLRPYHGPADRISGAGQCFGFGMAPRTIDSEAWAKPYFINGRQWAAKHRPKDFRVFFCEDRMEKPCAWLQ